MTGGLFSMEHPWASAFGILGNIVSFLVFLAPTPTFLRVYRKKSTEGFSSVPYVVALFSCALWIPYALVKTNSSPLLTINAFGCVVESAYILVYLIYAPRAARLRTLAAFLLLNVAAFSLIVFVTLTLVAEPHRVKVLGSICLAFSMAVFVAPMSVISTVPPRGLRMHCITTALLLCLCCLAIQIHATVDIITEGTDDGMELWGYVKVRPKANLFWWYYKSPQASAGAWPTILWLQGGPGVSGVGQGNFLEIGPLDIHMNQRNSTWLHKADLIFVDSPVGVGYSYVEDPSAMAKTDLQVALDMIQLLKQLSKAIPTLHSSRLFLVGESYGGKHAAMIGTLVIRSIKDGTLDLKLGGVVLGDSWISPDDYALSYPWLLHGMSRLDDNAVGDAIMMGKTLKQQMVIGQFTTAFDTFINLMHLVTNKSGMVNVEDIRLDTAVSSILSDLLIKPLPKPYRNTYIEDIMNGVVKKRLKIIPMNIMWQSVSLEVYHSLNNDFMKPAINEVDDLLSNGVNVSVYNGQFDLICSTFGTEAWVRRLKWHGLQHFLSLQREPLFYCQPYSLRNAFVRSYQNFNFYWILGAGHSVPMDQPCTALYMIGDIVQSPAS